MQLQVGVKVLIKNSEGLYLFIERTDSLDSGSASSWDIPGGRINPDENLEDALTREVKEEINYKMTSTPKLIAAQDIFVKAKELHVVRLTYLTTEDITDVTLSHEHQNHKWLPLQDTASINIEPYLRAVLDEFQGDI